jgi:hypothetical protein
MNTTGSNQTRLLSNGGGLQAGNKTIVNHIKTIVRNKNLSNQYKEEDRVVSNQVNNEGPSS